MKISNLTFIMTDDCNFNCSYCPQKKEKKNLDNETIERSVDFFYPFLKSNTNNPIKIGFYGGEPLLAFPQIQQTIELIQDSNKKERKHISYNLTTNGSLLTHEMLQFFDQQHLEILYSFDGLAQERGRKKNSLDSMVKIISKIQQHPNIKLEVNSVFTPGTIQMLTDSIRFIIKIGVPEITINISSLEEWNANQTKLLELELTQLTHFLLYFHQKTGKIPVKNFQQREARTGPSMCSAGKDQLSIAPDGSIWGCFLFHDYFKNQKESPQYNDYHLGTLDHFIKNHHTLYPEKLQHYSELRQDYYQNENHHCFLCNDLEGCTICPVNAAYPTGEIGAIPCSKCNLEKIQRNAKEHFHQKLSKNYKRLKDSIVA
jgi:sulfatase maturation enzyme AslB (radical SAM superfamily)